MVNRTGMKLTPHHFFDLDSTALPKILCRLDTISKSYLPVLISLVMISVRWSVSAVASSTSSEDGTPTTSKSRLSNMFYKLC